MAECEKEQVVMAATHRTVDSKEGISVRFESTTHAKRGKEGALQPRVER